MSQALLLSSGFTPRAAARRKPQSQTAFSGSLFSQQPALTFAGGNKKSLFTKLMLMATALLPLSAGLKPAVAQQPANVSGPVAVATSAREADIDETRTPFVDSKVDVPQINHSMKQAVVDLARSPLLKPQTRQDVENLLAEFNKTEFGQMAVVVIPDTHQAEINTLATNLFNEIGIGQAGKNDGIIMLVNKAAVQQNRSSGRMQIVTGKGIQNKLNGEQAVSMLRQFAVPHLKNGDYDSAVKNTVQGVINHMKSAQAGNAQHFFNHNKVQQKAQWTDEQIQTAILVGIVALIILILVIAAMNGADFSSGGGYSGGGYSSGSSWGSSSGSSWGSSSGSSWGGGGSWGGGSSGGSGGGI